MSRDLRVRYGPQESRQRRLDAVRSCAHVALARAAAPSMPSPSPTAVPAPAGRPDAPRIVPTAVPWDELVDSAQASVRQTWLPMVGRLIGLDDSAVRALSADDSWPGPPVRGPARTPAAAASVRP
ncbi:hypothetical protein ACH4D3_39695 [Streptomyces sp. NPDC018026]|uniref:hypothetical protein n=1 Tax=Streptomyces sp. NPDC018026 TaxID=3365031 RepID=UPI0037B7D4F7